MTGDCPPLTPQLIVLIDHQDSITIGGCLAADAQNGDLSDYIMLLAGQVRLGRYTTVTPEPGSGHGFDK